MAYMKRISVLFVLFALLFSSCGTEITPPGVWHPMEISQSEIIFDTNGGSCTVSCTNYSTWAIKGINITGTDIWYLANAGKDDSFSNASGEGISAKIGPEKNSVTISVDPSSEKHSWSIEMTVGDTGTTIQVIQN